MYSRRIYMSIESATIVRPRVWVLHLRIRKELAKTPLPATYQSALIRHVSPPAVHYRAKPGGASQNGLRERPDLNTPPLLRARVVQSTVRDPRWVPQEGLERWGQVFHLDSLGLQVTALSI